MISKLKNRGFTLVETLVAVLILTTAIAGPLTIASKSLLTALVAKDQVTAFYLAQDAVEFIRFKRDSACLADSSPCTNWLTDVAECVSADGSNACYVDSIANEVDTCSSGNCSTPLNYNSSSGANYFTLTGGAATIYKRSVKILNPIGGQPEEAQLLVVVSWSDTGSNTRTVTVTENLFNWQ